MENREEIGKWYDGFADCQEKTGVNLRHYKIMGFLTDAGLSRHSRVLEIGCGIGTLTGLLSRYLRKGQIVAVDISSRSVEIAKKRLEHAGNIMLMVSDMTDFHDPGLFDFIVLPDVLEHIPVNQHRSLFRTLASHMHDNSVILINIPHPRAIDYLRKTSPEKLQIIDQAIEADALLADAAASNLMLVNYVSYSLFNKEIDFAVITLRKKCAVTLAPLPAIKISARKMNARIRFLLSRL